MPRPFSIFMLMAPCRRLQFNLSDMYPVPRLGLGFLSAYLKAHGYLQTKIHDIIAHREWIPDLLAAFKRDGPPDLLAISVTILSLREAFEIAEGIKGTYPHIKVVVGGPGVGFEANALLKYGKKVDFFVRGEGEIPLLSLVEYLDRGKGSLNAIPGLIYRDGPLAKENPPAGYRDANAGPACDYHAMPMERYKLHPPMGIYPPGTMMETTRGCSYPCDFCCLSMPVRYQSIQRIEGQLKDLKRDFGIRDVHFIDPTFTLHRERTLEFCAMIKRLDLKWSCKTRVDRIDGPLAQAMAQSGCYLIAFGVESGDDQILSHLHKKAAAQAALEAFEHCRAHRIRTTAYLLVANPHETQESVARNMQFVRQLAPDYVLYDILQADPQNPLTQSRIAGGFFTQDDLERYYLSDEITPLHQMTVAGHSMDKARAWLKEASCDFYIRPQYFVEKIRDLRTLQDLVNLGAGGATFVKDALNIGRLWGL